MNAKRLQSTAFMPATDTSASPTAKHPRLQIALSALSALVAVSACFPPDDGTRPDLSKFNFPVGLALSNEGGRLYVANSDFDLRYNGGVVQVLDTAVIAKHLPQHCDSDADCDGGESCQDGADGDPATFLCVNQKGSPCGSLGLQTEAARFEHPGPCEALPLSTRGLLLESARIAPFVADIRYVPANASGSRPARLLMPVRGDATLHWADVEDEVRGSGPVLDCGQDSDRTCDSDHRRGDQRSEAAQDGELLPTEPFGIAVGDGGDVVFIGHQSQGAVSVFQNAASGPKLQSVLEGLPRNPIGLGAVPVPAVVQRFDLDYEPGVVVSYRFSGASSPGVELLRYFDAKKAAPAVPYLERAGNSAITTNSGGSDSRGLVLSDYERRLCEQACEESDCSDASTESEPEGPCYDCLYACAGVPIDAYLANRSPDSLLIGKTQLTRSEFPRDDIPDFTDTEALRGGPSRIISANIIDERGEPAPRVFVLAFNAQLMYIYDPSRGEIEAHVRTGPGPQSVIVDERSGLGYVAHFTESYVGVVDLDRRHATYGQVVLGVGEPQLPRSSK